MHTVDSIDEWQRVCIDSLFKLTKSIIEIFGEEYIRASNERALQDFLRWVHQKALQEYLKLSIACIGSESFALRHYMDNSKERLKMQL